MNKIFVLGILVLLAVSASLAGVSAKTMVAGKIYNSDFSDVVEGAEVTVTCNEQSQSRSSEADGTYGVSFYNDDCGVGDSVSVHAVCNEGQCTEYNSGNPIVGENTVEGTIHNEKELGIDVNLGVVNVPLIPEFSLAIGAITLVSAITVFFIIRRK